MIKILDELKNLIPPLSQDEYKLLEESIISEGCRSPLTLWGEYLVDGHHRLEICERHGIPYRTEQIEKDDLNSVKVWMIDNQSGRRNLTDGWKWELKQAKAAILAEMGREKQAQTLKQNADTVLSLNDKTDGNGHNTQAILAEDLGWSTGKVAQAQYIWKHADDETKDSVKSGELSIGAAYRDTKRAVAKEKPPAPQLPSDKYRVIYADPPWQYGNSMPEYYYEQADHYPLMTIKELCNFPIKNIADDNAVLFLWVTSPILEDAFQVINAWGFKYKSSFVWDKIKHNMGHYNSVRHELLLICVRGSCQPDVKKLFDSVYSEERTEHSKKPEYFRGVIDTIYPHGNRIELFAREKHDNWTVYGNEI